MIDFLASIVANGTVLADLGYAPWLPLPQFLPIALIASIIFWFFTRDQFISIMFFVSELTALIPTALMYGVWDLNPLLVFCSWVINTGIIMGGQLGLWWRAHREI